MFIQAIMREAYPLAWRERADAEVQERAGPFFRQGIPILKS